MTEHHKVKTAMHHKNLTAAALVLVSALSVSTAPAFAAPDSSKAAALNVASTTNPNEVLVQATAPEIGYYDMTPDFTTNLASMGRGRLHYVRIHVNIMVKDNADLPLVTEQDPLIRDAILSIIGTKEYNAIATAAGREALRAECRARVAEILAEKKGGPVLQDLLFTNYVYQ
ncbi:MAG: flagellar basal body-associated FliL family protein [Anaerobiospirillum sp.]|nr:flagellar basal body-associated FliL family protein [Anaerobiospirillum sp.]